MKTRTSLSQPCCLFDFRELALLLLCKKRLLSIFLLVFLIIGVLFCLFRPAYYQSQLLMLAQSNVSSSNINHVIGLNNHAGISSILGNNRFLNSQQKLMYSRRILTPVIHQFQLNLSITPEYFPLIGHMIATNYRKDTPAKPWFWLNHYSWGGDHMTAKQFSVSRALYFKHFAITYLGKHQYEIANPAGKILRTHLNVNQPYVIQLHNAGQIKINIRAFHARKGVVFHVYQYPTDAVLSHLRSRLSVKIQSGSNILDLSLKGDHAEKTAQILNAISHSAIHSYTQHTTESARKALLFLYSQLPIVHNSLSHAETALSHYQSQSGNVLLNKQAKLLTEKLYDLESQSATLDTTLAKLQSEYTNKSFQVRQTLTALKALQTEKQHLEKHLKSVPMADQKMVSLSRQAQVQNQTYTTLLNQIQYYELVKSSNIGALQIVDPAIAAYLPSNMHAIYVIILYLMLGLILGCISVILLQYFQGSVLYPKTASYLSQLPLVCIQYRSKDKAAKDSPDNTYQLLSESQQSSLNLDNLRLLRTDLIFELESIAQSGIISLVSTLDHSANSFTAANLAQTFADTGRKTLIVDADLREGNLHQYLQAKKQIGFKGYLQGKYPLAEVIIPTRFENLDFICAGKSTITKDVLLHPNCHALVDALSKDYDVVIFDLPALSRSPQSLILARHSNIVLLNICAEITDSNSIIKAKEQLDRADIQAYGCVFNKAYWPPKWLKY